MKATTKAPTIRYQVLYEDQEGGWSPSNLGIFYNREDAIEIARYLLAGFAGSRGYRPRLAIQELKPQPLPEGAELI